MYFGRRIAVADFLTLNGVTYGFDMHCHVKEGFNEDEMLRKICDIIANMLRSQPTLTDDISQSRKICLVSNQNKDIYQYLHDCCLDNDYNFLVFTIQNKSSIKIVLFGQIGSKHEDIPVLSNHITACMKDVNILRKLVDNLTTSSDFESVKNMYSEAIDKNKADIEMKKAELMQWTEVVCQDDPVMKEKFYHLIGNINVSASTSKIVLKSVIAVLFAELVEEIAMKYIPKTLANNLVKTGVTASGFKSIPLTGLAVGATFGVWRIWQGDLTGAGMEVASGAAACVPGAGTLTSLAIDACILAKDINEASKSKSENIEELTNQIKKIEDDLYNLSEAYNAAVCEYNLIKEVLESSSFSVEALKDWLGTVGEIFDHFDGSIFNTEGVKIVENIFKESYELL